MQGLLFPQQKHVANNTFTVTLYKYIQLNRTQIQCTSYVPTTAIACLI